MMNILIRLLIIFGFNLLMAPGNAALLVKKDCFQGESKQVCIARGGVKYLYIYDDIKSATYLNFIDVANQIPINKPFPKVYLNSRGGNPEIARQIGRLLRLRSAAVEGRDMISPDNEPHCSSACVLIAAGGLSRNFVQLEVHKGHLRKRIRGERYDSLPMSEDEIKASRDYYSEMGMDSELGRLIDGTTEKNEWISIKYDKEKPLNEQLIYKLGFLADEAIGQDLANKFTSKSVDDWNSSIALSKLANGGDMDAAYTLGYRLLYGIVGEKKDGLGAINWFKRAGELGNSHAYHMLGVIYRDDPSIVSVDLEASTRYFRMAAELGNAGSQNNLAWAYFEGKGVKRSIPAAIYWVTRSAEQGEPFAYSTLAQIRFENNGFPEDDIETLKWALLAVEGLPEGAARTELLEIKNILMDRMSASDRMEAIKKSNEWKPLKNGGSTMRDVADK